MKNRIIWGLTPVLGFFIGAFAAGILEEVMNFESIEFGSKMSILLIMGGMIPAYYLLTWIDQKRSANIKTNAEEMEELIQEIGTKPKVEVWENEDFLQNDINKRNNE